jgi:hypothetical protein
MSYTLAVKLRIGAGGGHLIHVAVDVREIYVAGSLAHTYQYVSQSVWCGENKRIILWIDTVVYKKYI